MNHERHCRPASPRVTEEAGKLRDALEALKGSGETPTNTKPKASAAARPRRATARRPARQAARSRAVAPESVQELLARGDAPSTRELTEHAGGDRGQVLAVLRALEARGDVRRTGARRGTRSQLITDADRIEQRAAELVSRNTSAPAALIGAPGTSARSYFVAAEPRTWSAKVCLHG
jgi:hypothetical protein